MRAGNYRICRTKYRQRSVCVRDFVARTRKNIAVREKRRLYNSNLHLSVTEAGKHRATRGEARAGDAVITLRLSALNIYFRRAFIYLFIQNVSPRIRAFERCIMRLRRWRRRRRRRTETPIARGFINSRSCARASARLNNTAAFIEQLNIYRAKQRNFASPKLRLLLRTYVRAISAGIGSDPANFS